MPCPPGARGGASTRRGLYWGNLFRARGWGQEAQDPEVGETLLSALIIWGDRAWVHAIEQVSSGVQVWGYLSEKVWWGFSGTDLLLE